MDEGQAQLACLLVSEVVTNAVLHASVTPSPVRRYDFDTFDVPVAAVVSPGALGADDGSPGAQAGGSDAHGGLAPGAFHDSPAHADPVRRPRQFTLRMRRGAESILICGCPGCAALPRPTRADAACTWSSSSPPAGDRVRPRKARLSGSRFPSTARNADRDTGTGPAGLQAARRAAIRRGSAPHPALSGGACGSRRRGGSGLRRSRRRR
jgi:hypothetical protein